MSANPLNEYRRLREAIHSRKAAIEAELLELERVLAGKAPMPEAPVSMAPVAKPRRVRNAMSLGDAVFSVTKEAPRSKDDILTEVLRLGYRFSEKATPTDQVASVLQTDRRFKEVGGKYGPTLEALFPPV